MAPRCGADAKVVHRDPGTGKLTFTADPERAKAAGEMLGRAVLEHLETGTLTPLTGSVTCALRSGSIRYGPRWTPEDLARQAYEGSNKNWTTWAARQSLALPDPAEAFPYDVQIWQVGEQLTLFAMEGEVCSPWGPMLRDMSPATFAEIVVADGLGARLVAVGEDFRFGRDRTGHVGLLREFGSGHGFETVVVPLVGGDAPVSSTPSSLTI